MLVQVRLEAPRRTHLLRACVARTAGQRGFRNPRSTEDSCHRPDFGFILKMGHTHAYVVEKYYFNLILNLMQAVAGQVFIKLLTVKILKS